MDIENIEKDDWFVCVHTNIRGFHKLKKHENRKRSLKNHLKLNEKLNSTWL